MSVSIGFPKRPGYRFRLNGRNCRVTFDSLATIERIIELYVASATAKKLTWLLSFRDKIKEIEALNSRSVLSLIAERTPDPKLRLLAIWLRGRCGGYAGTSVLAGYATSPDYRMRKEAVRALKRLSAWTVLTEVAAIELNDRIRQLATQPLPKQYPSRLADYSRNVRSIEVTSRPRRLWVSPNVDLREGKRPKPVSLIRQLLERIHALVTGNSMRSTV